MNFWTLTLSNLPSSNFLRFSIARHFLRWWETQRNLPQSRSISAINYCVKCVFFAIIICYLFQRNYRKCAAQLWRFFFEKNDFYKKQVLKITWNQLCFGSPLWIGDVAMWNLADNLCKKNKIVLSFKFFVQCMNGLDI